MDPQTWLEIQEALLFIFGPVLFWWFVVIVAASVLAALGVVFLELAGAMTR